MAASEPVGAQYEPRLHNEVYPFIYPAKFKGSLLGKVTIITGASGTIGKGLAECFAVAGAKLFLVYNKTEPDAAAVERCIQLGASSVTLIKCNVSELGECEGLVRQVLDSAGRVDILINNAGANGLAAAHLQDPQDFVYDFAVNLHGPYFLIRLLIPVFREQRSGCVLNIASKAGTATGPYSASYFTSKAALISLTGCIQKEFDAEDFHDVHLYSIHPGTIKSTMTYAKYGKESVAKLPPGPQKKYLNHLDQYADTPHLNGMACVALATGIAKDVLRGRYFDVEQDLGDVLAQSAAIKADRDMYTLHTSFLGGLSNLKSAGVADEPFEFPGF